MKHFLQDPLESMGRLSSSLTSSTFLTPRPAETFSDGQIMVTVVGHLAAQKTPDGGFVICVPADGSARVVAVASTRGSASWGVNIPGRNNSPLRGQSTALPLPVRPCDALWIVSGSEGGSDRRALGFAQASQPVDEALAVVFVAFDVRQEVVGPLLRPPVWGRRNVFTDFLRSNPFPINAIDWSKLPSVIDFDVLYSQDINGALWGAARPDFATYLEMHQHFPADLFSEWGPHMHGIPYTAHQGYGTFYMGAEGVLHMFGCSTMPLEQKKPAVYAILQRAIDNLGGLCDDSWRYALGGHCRGRRAGLVWLGHLYNIDIFADPTPIVGNHLPEDQFTAVTPWWGGEPFTGYIYSWQGDQNLWARHPSTWTGNRQVAASGERWEVMYGGQVIPAMLAQVICILLMGREHSAPKMCHAARSWVRGLPPAAMADLVAAGCGDLGIGSNPLIDYAVPAGLAAKAWQRYIQ